MNLDLNLEIIKLENKIEIARKKIGSNDDRKSSYFRGKITVYKEIIKDYKKILGDNDAT